MPAPSSSSFVSPPVVPIDGTEAMASLLRAGDFASASKNNDSQSHHIMSMTLNDDHDAEQHQPLFDTLPSLPAAAGGVKTSSNNPRTNILDDDDDEDEQSITMPPNLANLVAATIRDRVVLEQMEEIAALRAQLNASHRVEITGPNGSPVYARGNFSKGDFNAASLASINHNDEDDEIIEEAGLYWDVGLKTVQQQSGDGNDSSENDSNTTVPLNKLSNIEIRLGGVLYVASAEVEGTRMAFGIRPGNKFDKHNGKLDMTRSAVCEFNTEDAPASTTGSRSSLLTFHIRDFPRGHWRSLQSVAMLNRSIALRQQEREERHEERREIREVERRELVAAGEIDAHDEDYESEYESDYDEEEDQDHLDVYNYLTVCLPKRHPDQRADITSVSLCVKSVRGRIESLNRRGDEFRNMKDKFFRKIDELYQEEVDGIDSFEEEEYDA